MKKIFKWFGIVLGSLIGLVVLVGFTFFMIGNASLNKKYEFPPSNIAIPTDEASIEKGKHIADTLCRDCHGQGLSGGNMINDPVLGILDAANLTSGKGGIGLQFKSDEDYVRAIRHGINPQGKPIFMPAVYATSQLSDEDLGNIIAYVKTIPLVDNVTRGQQLKPLAKILMGAGQFPKLPVEAVSHKIHVTAPERGVSVEYGGYLVHTNGCQDCHGNELAGAKYPQPTVKLITPNITPGGEVGFWSQEEFTNTIRTGITPGGHQLSKYMPWKTYKQFTDDELKAIYMYLQSQPKLKQYAP